MLEQTHALRNSDHQLSRMPRNYFFRFMFYFIFFLEISLKLADARELLRSDQLSSSPHRSDTHASSLILVQRIEDRGHSYGWHSVPDETPIFFSPFLRRNSEPANG